MLKKINRLTKREFNFAFQASRAFNFFHFVVKFKPSSLPYSRFGVSCGLKISKKAVERNRIRRRMYEVLARKESAFPRGDYIIIVRPTLRSQSFADMERHVDRARETIYETVHNRSH